MLDMWVMVRATAIPPDNGCIYSKKEADSPLAALKFLAPDSEVPWQRVLGSSGQISSRGVSSVSPLLY